MSRDAVRARQDEACFFSGRRPARHRETGGRVYRGRCSLPLAKSVYEVANFGSTISQACVKKSASFCGARQHPQ
eukprot:scaffold47_cov258-Pinguiococcus_pyrenoidosus.AAC.94